MKMAWAALVFVGCATLQVATVVLPASLPRPHPGDALSYGLAEPEPRFDARGQRTGLTIGLVLPDSALAHTGLINRDVLVGINNERCDSLIACRVVLLRLEMALVFRWPFDLVFDRDGRRMRVHVAHAKVTALPIRDRESLPK